MKKIISFVMVAAMIAALAFTVSADDTPAVPTDGLLAHFTFDDAATGLTGNGAKATTAKAVAGEEVTVNDPVDSKDYKVKNVTLEAGGDPTITDDAAVGDGAYQFDGAHFLTVTKEDGTGLLDGVNSLTISYWAKHDTKTQWPFFATPNFNGGPKSQTYPKETYVGILEDANVATELYNSPVNGNKRTYSAKNNMTSIFAGDWHHVTVTIDTDNEDPELRKIKIFDNGVRVAESDKITIEQHTISEILGTDYTVFLGYATWGFNEVDETKYHEGELATCILDDMYIYGRALSEDEVLTLVEATPKKEDPVETDAPGDATQAPDDGKTTEKVPAGTNKPADGTETTAAPADEGGCGSTLGAAAAVVALTAVFGCAIVKKR